MREATYQYHPETNQQCRIIRPLLTLPKAELIGCCLDERVAWVEDPSNQSLKYTRNRVRQGLNQLAAEGFDADGMQVALDALRQTRQELDTIAQQFVQKHCRLKQSFIDVEWGPLQALSEAGQHHVLSGLISLISGGRIAQDKQIARVLSGLDDKGRIDVCVYEREESALLRLYRASPESNTGSQPLTPASAVSVTLAPEFAADMTRHAVVWDNRLCITVQAASQQALEAFSSRHQLLPLTKKAQVSIFQDIYPQAREVLKRLKPVRRDASVALATNDKVPRDVHILYAGMKPLHLAEGDVTLTCVRKPEFAFGKVWQLRS
jgi:hypothetical protein